MEPQNWPKEREPNHKALVELVETAFERDASTRALVRYVVVDPDEGHARPAFGRIDIARPDDPPPITTRPVGRVRLLEEEVEQEDFLRRLDGALQGQQLVVGQEDIFWHGMEFAWTAWRLTFDRENDGATWPVVTAMTDVRDRPQYRRMIPSNGPAGPFEDLDDAVVSLSGFKISRGLPADLRLQSTCLIVWDYRGKIVRLVPQGNAVRFEVEPAGDLDLEILLKAHTAEGPKGSTVPRPSSQVFATTAPIDVVQAELQWRGEAVDDLRQDGLDDADLYAGKGEENLSDDAHGGVVCDITFDDEPAGRGAWAEVWAGTDELERRVAVKFFTDSPSAQERVALQHAKALARVRHPQVVTVLNVQRVHHPETGDEHRAIVMEYVDGAPLSKTSGVSRADAVTIGRDLVDALRAIHDAGLVHADLHDGNVVVDGGRATVIDIMYTHTLAEVGRRTAARSRDEDCYDLARLLRGLLLKAGMSLVEAERFHVRALDEPRDLNTLWNLFRAVASGDSTLTAAKESGAKGLSGRESATSAASGPMMIEQAILDVVGKAQGGDADVQLRERELAELVNRTYPQLNTSAGQVAEIVRHMNRDGSLRLTYSEGDLLVLRVF